MPKTIESHLAYINGETVILYPFTIDGKGAIHESAPLTVTRNEYFHNLGQTESPIKSDVAGGGTMAELDFSPTIL